MIIIGAGYVGLATAHMFRDLDRTIVDYKEVIETLADRFQELPDLTNLKFATIIPASDFYFVCVPTAELENGLLDISLVKDVLDQCRPSKVVIRSTLPIGGLDGLQKLYPHLQLSYMPEFLREKTFLKDAEYSDRLIITSLDLPSEVLDAINKRTPKVLVMGSREAELIKLGSNAYLSTRLKFFFEINRYCYDQKLDFESVLNGLKADTRIGESYADPPFLIDGKCLPKDSKCLATQLDSSFLKGLFN